MSEAAAPERKTRLVGVDLQDSSDSHAVVEAIEADNTGEKAGEEAAPKSKNLAKPA